MRISRLICAATSSATLRGSVQSVPPPPPLTAKESAAFLFNRASNEGKRRARQVFSQPATFLRSCTAMEHLPGPSEYGGGAPVPEVCFVGRSNAGKSSLINAVAGERVALAAKRPGRTQSINIFRIGGGGGGGVSDAIKTPRSSKKKSKTIGGSSNGGARRTRPQLHLVDVPGYGFGSRETQMTLLGAYLRRRETLVGTWLLVEARVGITAIDEFAIELLQEAEVPFTIVPTKCDKLSPSEAVARVRELDAMAANIQGCQPRTLPVSSRKRQGVNSIRTALVAAAGL